MLSSNSQKTLPCEELLSLPQAIAYASPVVTVTFLMGSMSIVQGVYTKYFGLALGTLATLILIIRLFDAITDPLIGILSDRYYSDTNGRKVFVLAGGLLFAVSSYFLFSPVVIPTETAGSSASLVEISPVYFLVCSLAVYLAWTLFEIPHLTWAGELTNSPENKNKLYSLRALGATIGSLLFFAVPLLPFFKATTFTPETLRWSVIGVNIVLLPLLYLCFKAVPVGQRVNTSRPKKTPDSKKSAFTEFISIAISNSPFVLFLCAFICAGAGTGMWYGLLFIFVDVYLGVGDKLSLIYLISLGCSIIALGGWYQVANRFGKNIAWNFSMLFTVAGVVGSSCLEPGDGWLPLLLCVMVFLAGFTSVTALAPSILSDIVDYGTVKSGRDYGASYFSVYTLMLKSNSALGSALGFAIAGYFEFDPTLNAQTEIAVIGLSLSMVWLPSLLILMAMVFVGLMPINARHLRIIRRRLSEQKQRMHKYHSKGNIESSSPLDCSLVQNPLKTNQ